MLFVCTFLQTFSSTVSRFDGLGGSDVAEFTTGEGVDEPGSTALVITTGAEASDSLALEALPWPSFAFVPTEFPMFPVRSLVAVFLKRGNSDPRRDAGSRKTLRPFPYEGKFSHKI